MDKLTNLMKGEPVSFQIAFVILLQIAEDPALHLTDHFQPNTLTAAIVGVLLVAGWLTRRHTVALAKTVAVTPVAVATVEAVAVPDAPKEQA